MRRGIVFASALVAALGFFEAGWSGEVAIYTGNVSWIRSKPLADYHANITATKLGA